ncbi:similar to ricin-type beta-trefoil lectin domain/galactose oxidase domain protein [Plenodomus lingam JN3]|uniref:Similar to ricin-type beta-trefoil lectin domain/galactose oxidase domain protein n=1 Tax=Leptosphaeria maculans (strain JN3 / isolate v23.1.3 / race Av1-4-5-6-7-8) TaxID=985895 RepID=E5AB94_LEPMJ|nr:similar to ricin-type beta-trefoil lectin domain/galactose oxidase domain protein [Plenodomus lingam JN3]CBY00935.1 similar to ricin-type beta-trefoil lectin domain/galactose oxidase domain protein [Plenodomus lingam JN3]
MYFFRILLLFASVTFAANVALSRTGWTATANSFQIGNEPTKALDNDPNTFWHSKYSPAPIAPLPHWIVVDMKATYNVQAISIQPRPAANTNGRVGGHKVEVSTDNSNWQLAALGTYNNDAAVKKTTFVTRPARYVRITATKEAEGASDSSIAIADINIFQDTAAYAAPIAGKGLWEKTVDFPLVPAAVSLLPNGKTQTGMYDPVSGESSQLEVSHTYHDMFCPGISLDFNGRVVVTGGSNAAKTSIYDYASNAWTGGSDMKIQRGYQSTTTCSDGRIFNIGGSWSGGTGGKNGEIYNPASNTWTLLPGALVSPMLTQDRGGIWRADNHAWLFGWKNQTVFQAGPSIAMNWYDTVGSGSTTGAGNRLNDMDSMNGISVMYDAVAGKILTAGGATDYENDPAHPNAHIITLNTPKTSPPVQKTQSMTHARSFANAVVLPDGTVLVTGGQAFAKPFTDDASAMEPELWSPSTGTWTRLNPMTIPRNYHSVAILLPDATVFNGGGGLCGTCTMYGGTPASNHFDAEIFVPPYLLNADGTRRSRPVITRVAATVRLGASLGVETSVAVVGFALVRFGSATHTVNTDQRRIALVMGGSGNSYSVTIPGDAGVALPGFWLLFAMDASGTPSVGKVVKVTL